MTRRGLTLLELMVAMILTAILAWIALGMFSGESANFQRTREKVKLQSDAREGIRIIEEELRNAGYSNRILGASRISQTVSKCSEVEYSGDGEAIQATNSSSRTTGDAISVRFYEIPSTGVLSACGTGSASQFREISYRLDTGRLERRYRRSPLDSAASWIPILENVASFQIQYGMVTAVDDHPTNMSPAQTTSAANWTGFGDAFTVGGNATRIDLSGWNTNTKTAKLSTPIDTTRAGEAYKISFTASANAALLSAANGYDTSMAKTGSFMGMRVALMATDGTESARMGFRLPTVQDVAQNYEIFLTATANTNTSSNPVSVAFKGRLRAGGVAAGQILTITNLQVRRANRTSYYRWVYQPTAQEMAQVGAIRIHLLVQSAQSNNEGEAPSFTGLELGDTAIGTYTATGSSAKSSHILYQRIIPVVNNVL